MRVLATEIVAKHINEWDPMELLSIGAPDDEYETEIASVADFFVIYNDKVKIAEDIKRTFDNMFDADVSFDRCLSITHNIWLDLYE